MHTQTVRTPAAQLVGPTGIRVVERDLNLGDDEVLVKTGLAGVCDADRRAYSGAYFPPDLPSFEWLGHEGGGEVVAIGNKVREFAIGDKVMLFGPNNSWAHYFKAPVRNLHPVPKGLDLDVAYLGEPVAVGMFGVFQSGVQLGDDVAVLGLNFQGLIAVEGLKKRGAGRVIAVDYSDAHLELARQRGADVTINTNDADARTAILDLTNGKGAHVSFLSCGYWNPRAEQYFNLAVDVVRDEGVFVSLPDIMAPITANLHRLHHHGIDVRFPALMHHSPAFLQQWVPRVMQPVADGLIDIKGLITASYPITDAPEAMRLFVEDEDQVKVVLRPTGA